MAFKEDEFDAKIIKAVKKEMSSGIGASPSAPPLVATTVSMDTIQDLMQSQTSSLECKRLFIIFLSLIPEND